MKPKTPLAERLRPQKLADMVGQAHLLGEEGALRYAVLQNQPHSMILWGPPGVGKTTFARLLAESFACHFIALSAVLAGLKDVREALEQASVQRSLGQQTILFVDEIHRFHKGQQDALLPAIESGLVYFVGATTENPSFEINNALLSRARVYILQPLSIEDLRGIMQRAQTLLPLQLQDAAADFLLHYADGDARRLLNAYEQLAEQRHTTPLSLEHLQKVLAAQGQRRFDKQGEYFYDQISALHKSVRGSHPDAALYWLCRMLDGGADPRYLARRIVRMAWEDIGLADPKAMQLANDAALTYERLGSPEGELALAQCVVYLAVAAKSNAGYMAYKKARAFVQQDSSREVPLHLRNAPTKLMKDSGYGAAYRYAHDEEGAYAAGENYLPAGMAEPQWYQPVQRGLEIKIAEKLQQLRAWDAAARKKRAS